MLSLVVSVSSVVSLFFFFQAEDGIRDTSVTGVQTCALPISGEKRTPATTLNFSERVTYQRAIEEVYWRHRIWPKANGAKPSRSEERRVGKEGRSRGSKYA